MKRMFSTRFLVIAISLWTVPAFAASVHAKFVGCPADGQTGPVTPPAGKARTIKTKVSPPGPIAYYKGVQGYGVYAPAGWNCKLTYGSAGASLVVTPHAISPNFGHSYAAPIVEMSIVDGETSGRFEVARLGYMLFRSLTKDYVSQIENEGVLPPAQVKSNIEKKKYPNDSLTYLGKQAVRFKTPANTRGLGTGGAVKVSDAPIHGLVVLYECGGKPEAMSLLRLSLGKESQRWISTLLELNSPYIRSIDAC